MADVRDLEAQLNREEITYSRFVERLNEMAAEFYAALYPAKQEQPDEYWKKRCLAAENFINESPCDPDFTKAQIVAHANWKYSKGDTI